jgi:hypothetical protein
MTELSKEARELLAGLGDADGPSAAQTSRIKRKLGVGLGAGSSLLIASGTAGAVKLGAAGGTAAAAGAKLGGAGISGLVSMFVLGAAAGVGVSTTTAVVRNLASPPAPAMVTTATSSAERPLPVRARPGSAPVAAATAGDHAPPLSAAAPAPLAPVRAPAPVAALAEVPPSIALEPTLGPELELVIAAKRELAAGRPAQALAVVERLGREFPNGTLREERMLLRVLALCALGQIEPARHQTREFAVLAPRSPLLPRLEQSCGVEAAASPKPAGQR